MKPEPFYMIVNVGDQDEAPPCKIDRCHAPTFCHPSLEDAERECLRLASLYKGTFVIVKSVAWADWRETDHLTTSVMEGLKEWAIRMGLSARVQVRCIAPMDDPEIPF